MVRAASYDEDADGAGCAARTGSDSAAGTMLVENSVGHAALLQCRHAAASSRLGGLLFRKSGHRSDAVWGRGSTRGVDAWTVFGA